MLYAHKLVETPNRLQSIFSDLFHFTNWTIDYSYVYYVNQRPAST